MAVVFVVAVEPIGATNRLEKVVIAEFVIEVNINATRGVKTGQQFAHHDEELEVSGLFDEPPLRLMRLTCEHMAKFCALAWCTIEDKLDCVRVESRMVTTCSRTTEM